MTDLHSLRELHNQWYFKQDMERDFVEVHFKHIYLFIYLLSSKLATEFHFIKTACFSKRHGLEKGASFGSNFSLSQIRSGGLEMVITHILFLHSSGSAV